MYNKNKVLGGGEYQLLSSVYLSWVGEGHYFLFSWVFFVLVEGFRFFSFSFFFFFLLLNQPCFVLQKKHRENVFEFCSTSLSVNE